MVSQIKYARADMELAHVSVFTFDLTQTNFVGGIFSDYLA